MTNYTHDPSLGVRDEEIQNFNALDCSGDRIVIGGQDARRF